MAKAKQKEDKNETKEELTDEPASKEVEAIFDALHVYEKKHHGDVQIILGVVAYDSEGEVIDERLGIFGTKKGLLAVRGWISEEIEKMPEQDCDKSTIEKNPDNYVAG